MSFRQVAHLLKTNSPLSEADPNFSKKMAQIPAAQRAAIEAAQRSVSKSIEQVSASTGLVDPQLIAKHKIEVLFGPKRTTTGPNAVRIALWESGSKLHGGGDASLFFCKDGTTENGEGCWSPITQDQVRGPIAYCKNCNLAINSDKLTIHKEGYITTKFLAAELVKLFRQLGSSADIYCKYNRDDIHYIAMARQHGDAKAAKLLGLHIYPLKNIVKDTMNGADLGKRFMAFLTS